MKILVDAMNLVHRCYHIYDERQQLSFKNRLTGLEYGVLKNLHSLRKYSNEVILVWEPIISNKSSQTNYKERINTKPANFYERINKFQEALANFFPSVIETYTEEDILKLKANIECDTIIHNITQQNLDTSFIIYSNDKDFFQSLETQRVRVLRKTYKDYIEIYDEKDFCLTYEPLRPIHWPFYRAITGDPSDNIKGSPRLLKTLAMSLVIQANLSLEKLKELLCNLDQNLKMGQSAREFVLSGQIDTNFKLIKFGVLPKINIPKVNLDSSLLDDYMRELGIQSLLTKFQ